MKGCSCFRKPKQPLPFFVPQKYRADYPPSVSATTILFSTPTCGAASPTPFAWYIVSSFKFPEVFFPDVEIEANADNKLCVGSHCAEKSNLKQRCICPFGNG